MWLGAQDKVPLVVSRSIQVTAPAGQTANPRVVAKFDGPLPAPIAKGTKVGTAVGHACRTAGRSTIRSRPAPTCRARGWSAASSRLARHYLLGWLS